MQSSSLAFLLTTRYLSAGLGPVPSALSVATMLLWGFSLAIGMRRFAVDTRPEEGGVGGGA
jgi:hypothetical protein